MRVLTFKLITGEEIIGREAEQLQNQPYVKLSRVRTIGVQPAGRGQMGIGLMPFVFSQQDDEIILLRTAIIAEFRANPEIEKIYLEQTSPIKLVG